MTKTLVFTSPMYKLASSYPFWTLKNLNFEFVSDFVLLISDLVVLKYIYLQVTLYFDVSLPPMQAISPV
jgi:hypothetical protein